MGQGRRASPHRARHVRTEDAARQAPHPVRRRAGARSGGDRRGAGRARADHGRGLRQGLGPHPEGPGRRSLRPDLQDRRQPRHHVLRRDHVEAAAVRDQRQVLHPGRGEAARRPRPRRSDPHVHRHGAGRLDRLAVREHRWPQVPGREP